VLARDLVKAKPREVGCLEVPHPVPVVIPAVGFRLKLRFDEG
jgi:hypothetical protein